MESKESGTERPHLTDADCVAILQWAAPALGLRWQGFRRVRKQVCKRIRRRMNELGTADVGEYRARVVQDRRERQLLDEMCRVTISRFFRDRAMFERLRAAELPPLVEQAQREGRRFRVWSAGCCGGEEPYSFALLMRLGLPPPLAACPLEVVATDSDETQLARAEAATYHRSTLRELPADWIDRAFIVEGDQLRLLPAFREPVRFLKQDLRLQQPAGNFEVVLCRNVAFTYFDPSLAAKTLERIRASLLPGGLLIIGIHEDLPKDAPGFQRTTPHLPIFRRLA